MKVSTHFSTTLRNNLAGLLLLLAIWWVLAQFFPRYVLPSPGTVFVAVPAFLSPAFLHHLGLTLSRVLAGFTLALLLGTVLGLAAHVAGFAPQLNGFMAALQVIPGMILGVLLLLVLGIGSRVPVALVALLTLPAMAINTASALARRSTALEGYLISAGGKLPHLVRFAYLPALVPTLQSNLSIGFGLAIKVVIMGEFIGAQDGLGYLLNVAAIYFRMKEVLFYLAVVLVVTAAFEMLHGLLFATCFQKYFYPE